MPDATLVDMKGFDTRWRDLPHYILGITNDIWEGRDVASLRRLYAPDIPLRTPGGIVIGNEAVIAATLATLHEFPDRELLGDDVIWCGVDGGHYLSSHRVVTTATHSGHGSFGPPTGQRVAFRVIADCAVRDNVIDDEWLIRDTGAVVRQLGMDPERVAVERLSADGASLVPFHPSNDVAGPYAGVGNDDEWGHRYVATLEACMAADFATARGDHDRAVQIEAAGGRTLLGYPGLDASWLALRSSFPSATFEVHHRIGRQDPLLAPRAAVRWSLTGTHDGHGEFGPPTGAPVHVMGIAHAEYGPYGIRREWLLYDEVAIWMQIRAHAG